MIEKYKSEVIEFYELKRDAGQLSPNLTNITPAKIRKEVFALLSACTNSSDVRMLKEFFELPFQKQLSDIPFRKWDIDKFRPLCTFLKKRINTRDKNIELLAWLIDFQPRPFSNYWRSFKGKSGSISELLITERGIIKENNFLRSDQIQGIAKITKDSYPQYGGELAHSTIYRKVESHRDELASVLTNNIIVEKQITLEYPSGVKLSVDACDINLIAKLVKL
ncbi:hypothetical protein SAMN05421827_102245 [Pedobacter terrae]|uniref:Uncharacterized protein n=1 Tax=Pedobacter terrae TaxID=405671 RepID=A0A1G7QCY1_9SPHI|nr:hypothetical protein [Pedobacter terrae]SDF95769.1 hypothetical protein SAMN05421827_102245 [Pedobacter terrae]